MPSMLAQSSTAAKGITTLLAVIWGVMWSPYPLVIGATILFTIFLVTAGMIKSHKDFCWSKWNAFTFGSLAGYILMILLGTAGEIAGISMVWGYTMVMGGVSFAAVQIMEDYKFGPPWITSIKDAIKKHFHNDDEV